MKRRKQNNFFFSSLLFPFSFIMPLCSNALKSSQSSRTISEDVTLNKKRPFLYKYRSSHTFVFWTAAVGLFTSVKKANQRCTYT